MKILRTLLCVALALIISVQRGCGPAVTQEATLPTPPSLAQLAKAVPIGYEIPDEETARQLAREAGVDQFALITQRVPSQTDLLAMMAYTVEITEAERQAEMWEMARRICEARVSAGILLSPEECMKRVYELDIPGEWFADYLGDEGIFQHSTLEGCNPSCQVQTDWYPNDGFGIYNSWQVIQIIAGVSTDAETVLEAFRASPAHWAAILYSKNELIGIGLVFVEGSPYGWYWVINFGFSPVPEYTVRPSPPEMGNLPESVSIMLTPSEDSVPTYLAISSIGEDFNWTATTNSSAIIISSTTGFGSGQVKISPAATSCTPSTDGSTILIGSATVVVTGQEGTLNSPQEVRVEILCTEEISRIYLPITSKNGG
ncbi:hypothetical protein KKB83_04800 [Patescibacteria group bacterium]|nr:hypothetical protein [Patescibacteria group bacterium]